MYTRDCPAPANLDPAGSTEGQQCGASDLAPPDLSDPVIEMYKNDVDRTLLIKNLGLTPAQRAEKLVDFMGFLDEMRRAERRRQAQE